MKIINYVLAFTIAAVLASCPLLLKAGQLRSAAMDKVRYGNALDHAVDDAFIGAVETDTFERVSVNRDLAAENFFHSLYANMGVLDNESSQETLRLYVPVILVTEADGFYVYHSYQKELADGRHTLWGWSEKQPYCYAYGNLAVNFSISDSIQVYDRTRGELYEGDYREIARLYPEVPWLGNPDMFDRVRRTQIISCITERMSWYINQHNRIASDFGITYRFGLPSIEQTDWDRTVNDISIMAIFQGYPFQSVNGTFNRYEVGGARIRKTEPG